MLGMERIHLQLEEYQKQNGRYPFGDWQKVGQLIRAGTTDEWGNEYYYETCPDQKHYALISPGADRTFKRETWMIQGDFPDRNEDVFLQNGVWLRSWSENGAPVLSINKQKTVFDELTQVDITSGSHR
jgi:hypothetical protein